MSMLPCRALVELLGPRPSSRPAGGGSEVEANELKSWRPEVAHHRTWKSFTSPRHSSSHAFSAYESPVISITTRSELLRSVRAHEVSYLGRQTSERPNAQLKQSIAMKLRLMCADLGKKRRNTAVDSRLMSCVCFQILLSLAVGIPVLTRRTSYV